MSDNIFKYILKHGVKGACTCGKCVDAPANPEELQPTNHSVNLTFFHVSAREDDKGSKEEFKALVMAEHPEWLNGEEHNYIKIGAELGNQGIALVTIGYGHVMGLWQAFSPDIVMPFLPKELKNQMAGSGMVSLKYVEEEGDSVESSIH